MWNLHTPADGCRRGSSMERTTNTALLPVTQLVPSNGLTFPVMMWGRPTARPVLLLHGFPQEPATWSPVAEVLAKNGFRAIAPFQRGYVASTRPQDPHGYTFAQFVLDALGLADSLNLPEFDVVGLGIGGVQAWMVAAYNPSKVRSLTSIRYPHPAAFARALRANTEQKQKWARLQQDLGAGNPGQKATAMLADDAAGLRRFLSNTGLPESVLEHYIARLSEPGALAGALYWNQAISLDEFLEVPPVSVATLLIWNEGPALARAAAEASASYVKAPFTKVPVADGSPFILETSPTVVIEPLLEHLRLN